MKFFLHDVVSFLMIPTCMSFVSSMIGVVCLAFTEFDFVRVFVFQPLVIVMATTYFNGCWWLPALLSLLNWDILHLGEESVMTVASSGDENTQAKSSSPADSRQEQVSETLGVADTSKSEYLWNDQVLESVEL